MSRNSPTHLVTFSFDSGAAPQLKPTHYPAQSKSRATPPESQTPSKPAKTADKSFAEPYAKSQKANCGLPRVYIPKRLQIKREQTVPHLATLNSSELPELLRPRVKSLPKPLKSLCKRLRTRSIVFTGCIPEAAPHRLVVPEVQASTNPTVQLFPKNYPKYRISVEFGLYRNVRKYAGVRGLATYGASPVSKTITIAI